MLAPSLENAGSWAPSKTQVSDIELQSSVTRNTGQRKQALPGRPLRARSPGLRAAESRLRGSTNCPGHLCSLPSLACPAPPPKPTVGSPGGKPVQDPQGQPLVHNGSEREILTKRYQAEGKETRRWVETGVAMRLWGIRSFFITKCNKNHQAGPVRRRVPRDRVRCKEPSWRGEAGPKPLRSGTIFTTQMELFRWFQARVMGYRVWKGHLWGSAWRRWHLHMAVFLAFSWSPSSSFSSSSSPKLLSPSFVAFFFSFSFSSVFSLLLSLL